LKSLLEIFPRASQSVIEANPQLAVPKPEVAPARGIKKRGSMNKTETEFARILEAQRERGEILRFQYEGITLRWLSGDDYIRYTPDFVVFYHSWDQVDPNVTEIKFIEVKGAFTGGKFERAIERFRHAKSVWPEFTFEMWKKKGGLWKQIM
jgi:hypothetical protein